MCTIYTLPHLLKGKKIKRQNYIFFFISKKHFPSETKPVLHAAPTRSKRHPQIQGMKHNRKKKEKKNVDSLVRHDKADPGTKQIFNREVLWQVTILCCSFTPNKKKEKKRCCHIPHVSSLSLHMEHTRPALQSRHGSGCRGSEAFSSARVSKFLFLLHFTVIDVVRR